MPVTAEEVARAAAEHVLARRAGRRRAIVEHLRLKAEALAGRWGTENGLSTQAQVVRESPQRNEYERRTTQKAA